MAYKKPLEYINSTSNLIANSGSDEKGKYTGGNAGDQTGKEWSIRSWYSRPWTKMYRYEKDARVGMLMAIISCLAACNDKIGYDQYQRTSYWTQLSKVGYDPSKITTACEEDCSAGVCANLKAVGYLLDIDELKNIAASNRTATMNSALIKAGFTCYTASKYLSSGNYLMPGDVLLYPSHHTASAVNKGKNATATAKYVKDLDITIGGIHYTGKYGIEKTETDNTPAKALTLGDRELENGDEGADVKELQQLLIKAGYSVGSSGADGEFGDATEEAVKKFQEANKLDADGIAGAKTIAALKKATTTKEEVKEEETKEETKEENEESSNYNAKVSGGKLNVRKGPSTAYGVKKVLANGTQVTVYREENGFACINEVEGLWCSLKYLVKI